MNEPEKDKCILCGEETEYDITTNIYYRNHYIQGAGQLCKLCYERIYGK